MTNSLIAPNQACDTSRVLIGLIAPSSTAASNSCLIRSANLPLISPSVGIELGAGAHQFDQREARHAPVVGEGFQHGAKRDLEPGDGGWLAGEGFFDFGFEPVGEALEDGLEDVAFAGKVEVGSALRPFCGLNDLVHSRLMVAAFGEDVLGRIEQKAGVSSARDCRVGVEVFKAPRWYHKIPTGRSVLSRPANVWLRSAS